MSFDPFGDAKTKGYLRNIHGLPIGERLKDIEHQDFSVFLPDAMEDLMALSAPGYDDLLTVHRDLFGGIYPWAGQDRFELFPNSVVSKGSTQFALSNNIRKAFQIGLSTSNTLGQTLGHWAYAHPFLDGNGRALFTFFDDHLRRKGIALNWAGLDKSHFLRALDAQIDDPNGTAMDKILSPLMTRAIKGDPLHSRLMGLTWRQPPKK